MGGMPPGMQMPETPAPGPKIEEVDWNII
jgi:hypothetical protein